MAWLTSLWRCESDPSLQVEVHRRGLVILGQPAWTTGEKLLGAVMHNSQGGERLFLLQRGEWYGVVPTSVPMLCCVEVAPSFVWHEGTVTPWVTITNQGILVPGFSTLFCALLKGYYHLIKTGSWMLQAYHTGTSVRRYPACLDHWFE